MLKRIDAKGKNCPIPVVMAKQAIAEGETAFTIEVDNKTAVENLSRLAASNGFSVSVHEESGVFALEFTTSGGEHTAVQRVTGDYAVFVGRDIIGSGEAELGSNLMRMFFYTLANSDDLPRSILFMNAGVKLPTLDEQVVEHLTVLERKGVEVLVCGACLNFYGIAEQLKAGIVSNMFDIVSRMQAADKVITL